MVASPAVVCVLVVLDSIYITSQSVRTEGLSKLAKNYILLFLKRKIPISIFVHYVHKRANQ